MLLCQKRAGARGGTLRVFSHCILRLLQPFLSSGEGITLGIQRYTARQSEENHFLVTSLPEEDASLDSWEGLLEGEGP